MAMYVCKNVKQSDDNREGRPLDRRYQTWLYSTSFQGHIHTLTLTRVPKFLDSGITNLRIF